MPVIKSMSRKGSPNFRRIVNYILKEQQAKAWTLLHNMQATPDDKEAIIQAFIQNDTFRKKRKNGNAYYHEILSFSNLDYKAISSNIWILEDLTQEYLNRRTDGIALAYPHIDDSTKSHPSIHVHILLSANELESSSSIRISKAEFKRIKRAIEEIQAERYPEIVHSTIQKHLGKSRNRGR